MFMESMAVPRWRVVGASWELGWRLRGLRQGEGLALERAGERFRAVAAGLQPGFETPWEKPVADALAPVIALEEHERELAQRLATSLAADRRDYRATDSDLGRWLIVVRGILDRLVVRDEAWRARRELPGRLRELGARVMADAAATEALPADERARAAAAQKALRDAASEREALLAPYGGQALPNPLRVLVAECATFFEFVRDELSKKVVLRLPAYAAMGAAWWVTHHFTSGRFEGRLNHYFGVGRTGLSPEAIDWMSFWLPVLAAALLAYVLSTLTKRVRRRYLDEG
jgi:hypothetical protein